MRVSSLFKINVVMAALFLIACKPASLPTQSMYQPVPTIVEPGLAYGQPCSPPCGQGLTPGKSTSADAAKAMEQIQASGWAKTIEGSPITGFAAYPSPYTMQGTVGVYVENGVVSYTLGNLLFDYSVGEMVRHLGEPESLYLVYRGGQPHKASCAEHDFKAAIHKGAVVILYPSQGMVFLTSVPYEALGLVCPEMKILAFCYYTPLPVQETLKGDYLADICGLEALRGVTEKDLVKWHGFGAGY